MKTFKTYDKGDVLPEDYKKVLEQMHLSAESMKLASV